MDVVAPLVAVVVELLEGAVVVAPAVDVVGVVAVVVCVDWLGRMPCGFDRRNLDTCEAEAGFGIAVPFGTKATVMSWPFLNLMSCGSFVITVPFLAVGEAHSSTTMSAGLVPHLSPSEYTFGGRVVVVVVDVDEVEVVGVDVVVVLEPDEVVVGPTEVVLVVVVDEVVDVVELVVVEDEVVVVVEPFPFPLPLLLWWAFGATIAPGTETVPAVSEMPAGSRKALRMAFLPDESAGSDDWLGAMITTPLPAVTKAWEKSVLSGTL